MGRKRPCIKKCCPLDQILTYKENKTRCRVPSSGSTQFMPRFYDDFHTKSTVYDSLLFSNSADESKQKSRKSFMPHFIISRLRKLKQNCKPYQLIPLPTSKWLAQVFSNEIGRGMEMYSSLFRIRTDGAIMYIRMEDNKCKSMSMVPDTFCVDGMFFAESPFNNTEDEYVMFQCPVEEKDHDLVMIAN